MKTAEEKTKIISWHKNGEERTALLTFKSKLFGETVTAAAA